jgi:hypothetical protein
MTLNYNRVWSTLNDLEMVSTKISSAREILDCAVDRLQEHQYDKAETLLYAADEFLQYYLEEFDRKFKDAWKETVTKLKQQEIDDCMPPWGHSDLEYGLANPTLTEDRNSNFPGENTICDNQDTSPECKSAWNSFWEEDVIKEDKVVKWVLRVQQKIEDGIDDYYIQFPDDLLEAANLKAGDQIEWVDMNNGTFILRKPNVIETNS